MINNTLFILLVILALGEIVFGILCSIWLKRLDKTIDEMDRYRKLTIELYKSNKTTTDRICEDMINISEIMDVSNDAYEKIFEAYGTMNETYKTMTDAYHAVSDQFSKLLEAWKNIEERYSDCFDQYKHTHECLKKCMDLMTPIATEIPESIEELGMKLNDVQEIVSQIDDNMIPNSVMVNYSKGNLDDVVPTDRWWKETEEAETDDDDYFNATEGETSPDPDAMKEFYETNGFEDIRKKALEEDS